MRKILTIVVTAFCAVAFNQAQAQVMINSLNTPYNQDFNSLANTGTSNSLPTGWAITEAGTHANADGSYMADDGGNSAGNVYSYGATGSSERALGSLQISAFAPYYGVQFTNNSGSTILEVDVQFDVELWRIGGTGRLDSIFVAVGIPSPLSPNDLSTGFWTTADTVVSPHNDSAAGALNGNLADNRITFSRTITTAIPQGQSGWLRFMDVNISGSDDGLAIDNFKLVARGLGGPNPIADCSEPFISEYIEGSSFNKSLEIYNPTSGTIDLSDYVLYRYNNGSIDPTSNLADSLFPVGMLNSGGVFIISHPSADNSILGETDTMHLLANFNGDDVVMIIKRSTGDTLDLFGVFGQDPGTEWPIGSGSTANHTLVRKASVEKGTTDSATWADSWDVYSQDDFTFLGSHTSDCIAPPAGPIISFASKTQTETEGSDTLDIEVTIMNPSSNDITVDVALDGTNTTANPADYDFTPQTLIFPANSTTSQFVEVIIKDDADVEPNENVVIRLQNLSEGSFGDSVHTITIEDNDYHMYTIDTADNVDADGFAIHENEKALVHGVVTSNNYRSGGLNFTIYDHTAGIHIFNSSGNFGYTVTRGDSIAVWGTINPFNGLAEIIPDSIRVISTGNALPTPMLITQLGENTEGELVKMRRVWLVDPSQWLSSGSFNADITNGSDTIQIRIESNVITGYPAPTGMFSVTGVGGQYDFTTNDGWLSGYQLLPRDTNDIMPFMDPTIAFAMTTASYQEADSTVTVTINISNSNDMPTDVEVALSSAGTATTGDDFTFTPTVLTFAANSNASKTVTVQLKEDAITEPNETIVLILRNKTNLSMFGDSVLTITITDDDPIGIQENQLLSRISLYPNPAKGNLTLTAEENLDVVRITNLLGQQVLELKNVAAGTTLINVADLEKGVYLLNVYTKEGKATQRFIKE